MLARTPPRIVGRCFAPKVRITPTPALKQKQYRDRQGRQEIRPVVPLTARNVELLVALATRYGKISRREAERRAANRGWIVQELTALLTKLADDLGIQK